MMVKIFKDLCVLFLARKLTNWEIEGIAKLSWVGPYLCKDIPTKLFLHF